ncbi:MAG: peptidylprolyl isomerase [Verrucomicrobia bacterium]|nr:peptidylprolyl isomerase [Verrucomicrobiota bacterium]
MHRPLLAALGAAVLLSVPPVPGGAASSANLFNDVVVARGKGLEVRRGQLDDAFITFKANLAARGQGIAEDKRLQAEAQLLDRLIVSQILVTKATAADKAKAREKVDKVVADIRQNSGSDEGFLRQLRSLGMTAQQFTNRALEQGIAEEILGREIRTKISIPPERIKEFYETNDAAFRVPELARASHILILTRDPNTRMDLSEDQKKAKREKAEKVLARAKKGEDFAKLAEETSEDPAVKQNKGELQFVRSKDPARGLVSELETAAFALRPGEVGNLLVTEYGFHVLKLHELTPEKKKPLTEVSDKIREFLLDRETEKQLPDYFEKLKKENNVEILDSRLAEALAQSRKEAAKP